LDDSRASITSAKASWVNKASQRLDDVTESRPC